MQLLNEIIHIDHKNKTLLITLSAGEQVFLLATTTEKGKGKYNAPDLFSFFFLCCRGVGWGWLLNMHLWNENRPNVI